MQNQKVFRVSKLRARTNEPSGGDLKMTHKRLLAGLTTGLLLLFSAHSSAEDWSFEFEPYIFASTIEGDTGVGRAIGVEVDVDLSDILEVLDMAFMGHFEAHHTNG